MAGFSVDGALRGPARTSGLSLGGGLSYAPSGGGSYHADAVHFDGATTYLKTTTTLTSTSNKLWSWGGWLKFETGQAVPVVWVIDPEGGYYGYMEPSVSGGGVTGAGNHWGLDIANRIDVRPTSLEPLALSTWLFFLASIDITDADPANWLSAMYINDVNALPPLESFGAPFNIPSNGLPFWVGYDSFGDGDFFKGDMADVRFMPGVSIVESDGTISEVHRRLFIDASGKPVDPAVATAALGAPCILFSGNAAAFGTNQGTGGAFTTTGTLTNASSSPSD